MNRNTLLLASALLATTVGSFFSLSAILWLMRHSAGWLG